MARDSGVRRCGYTAWESLFQPVRVHLAGLAAGGSPDRAGGYILCETTARGEDGRMVLRAGGGSSDPGLSGLLRRDSAARFGSGLVLPAGVSCRLAVGHPRGTATR